MDPYIEPQVYLGPIKSFSWKDFLVILGYFNPFPDLWEVKEKIALLRKKSSY